jgi:hypothetical protein
MRFRPVTDIAEKLALPTSVIFLSLSAVGAHGGGGPITVAVRQITMTYTDTTANAISSRFYRV